MGRGFGHLGWLEKEKGQVQPRGPGSGPQMVPLGPLFCTPYPHPCHTDPGGLHLRLSFGLTSSLSGHLTSPSAAKPDLLSLQGPVFPLLQPHCGCSVPLSFTVSQGSGCSSHGHIPVTGAWELSRKWVSYPQLTLCQKVAARRVYTFCPLHPNHSCPPLQAPERRLVTAAWEATRPPPSTTVLILSGTPGSSQLSFPSVITFSL